MTNLDGFVDVETLGSLREINASSTGIAEIGEISKLKSLPLLDTIKLTDAPVSGIDNYAIEMLIVLPKLKMLDEDEITEEQRQEAKDLIVQREEEAKAKAEAEAEEENE